MRKIQYAGLLIVLSVMMSFLASCKEDETPISGDLFRPKLASEYPKAVKNTIKLLWYEVIGAKSYTIQIADDEEFSNIIIDEETTDYSYTSPGLPYDTKFFIRMRTNAPNEINNSIWRIVEVTTEVRDVEPILFEVSEDDISETTVIIKWKVDDNYPADFVTVVPTGTGNTVEKTIDAKTFAEGQMIIEGLEPNTNYRVTLYNNAVESVYERAYNTVSFKTAGAPDGARVLNNGDDLDAMLKADQQNSSVADGQIYYLRGGSYNISGFTFSKGFRIMGAIGSETSVNINATFTPATDNAGQISFENIQLTGSQRLIDNEENDGKDYTWQGIKLTKCNVSGFPTGFVRLQTSSGNVKTIVKFEIDNCIFDGMQGGRLIETNNFSDQSTISAVIESVAIKNSTFLNSPQMLLLFLPDAYGYSGSNIQFEMTNVTVVEALSNGNKRMIQMNRLPKTSTVTIQKCLFSNESCASNDTYMFYETCLCGSATTSYADNYISGSRSETGRKGVNAKILNMTQDQLFVDMYSGDLTIKDKTSVIYIDQIGDPRWIK